MAEFEDDLGQRFAELYRRVEPSGGAGRDRLLREIRTARRPRRRAAALAWLARPCPFELSPLAALAAVVALLVLGGGLEAAWRSRSAPARSGASRAAVAERATSGPVVQFVLVAPGVSRVQLVGDFNGWNPEASPMRRAGNSWTLSIPIGPGRHVYAFILDGSQWVSDPAAPLAPDDEFGFRKSVLVVGGSGPT